MMFFKSRAIGNTRAIGAGDTVIVEYEHDGKPNRARLELLASVVNLPGTWPAVVFGKRTDNVVRLPFGLDGMVAAKILVAYPPPESDANYRSG